MEFAVFDHVDPLRRNALVIISERSEARAVRNARIGHYIDNGRGVTQFMQLIEREKTRAGKIGLLSKNAVEFDGMTDGFVDL